MASERVEIVKASIDAVNREDWDGALEHAAPGFEMDLSLALGPQRAVYGLDEMETFWREFMGGWESVRIEPHEFIESGEHVVVPWTMHAIGRDGIEVRARVTWTYAFRDGAVARVRMYQEREDALQALGIAPAGPLPKSGG